MDTEQESRFFDRLHNDDLVVFRNPDAAPQCGFVMEKQPTTKKVKVLLYPYAGDTLWIGDRTVLVRMESILSVHRPRMGAPDLTRGVERIDFAAVDLQQ